MGEIWRVEPEHDVNPRLPTDPLGQPRNDFLELSSYLHGFPHGVKSRLEREAGTEAQGTSVSELKNAAPVYSIKDRGQRSEGDYSLLKLMSHEF